MMEKRNAYRTLVREREKKRRVGIPRRAWMDNIEMDLIHIRIVWGINDWIDVALDRDQLRALVSRIESSGSMKCCEILK
jgi:hypothetical protein